MDMHVFPVLTESDYKLPFYITSAGQWVHQSAVDRPHGFADYQWIQCTGGAGRLTLANGEQHEVGPGQGMWLLPGEQHAYEPTEKPWSVKWISFNGPQLEPIIQTLKLGQSAVRIHFHPERTLTKMEEALVMLRTNAPHRSAEGSALVYSILMDLYEWTSPGEVRNKKHAYDQMAPVFAFIEEHYASPITLEQLAKVLSVSEQHTCLLFRQTTGLRPFEYITRFRLRKAKELLLQQPTLPVKSVAERVGYEHVSYFIKRFKMQEGITPSRFRQIYRKSSTV